MTKIGGRAKDEEPHIADTRDESDKANADFGRNPLAIKARLTSASSNTRILVNTLARGIMQSPFDRADYVCPKCPDYRHKTAEPCQVLIHNVRSH